MFVSRRGREETLALRTLGPEAATTMLVTRLASGYAEPSQRRFLVGPDGNHLLWSEAGMGARVIEPVTGPTLRIEGAGPWDARFSADGRRVAALARRSERREWSVVVLDLATAAERSLGVVGVPQTLEWVRDGVVVEATEPDGTEAVLTYFPLEGPSRRLASTPGISHFAAGAQGTRVVFFAAGGVYTVDTLDTSVARRITPDAYIPENLDAAPDGRRVAFATMRGTYLLDGDAPPRELPTTLGLRSLWFSPDGRELVLADTTGAVVLPADGSGPGRSLPAPAGDLQMVRYRRGGRGLVVARRNEVQVWYPDTHRSDTIARVEGESTVAGADVFADRVALFTTRELPAPVTFGRGVLPRRSLRGPAATGRVRPAR